MSIKTLEALELLKSWVNLANWEDNDVSSDEARPWAEGIDEWTTVSRPFTVMVD
jgi:hypothetical protein